MNGKQHQMDFGKRPGQTVLATPDAPAPNVQSENSIDADSISIHLSEADNTDQQFGQNEEGKVHTSWREEEENSDCNLSEVNYRSAAQTRNRDVPESQLQKGASNQLGAFKESEWQIVEEKEGSNVSPEPKRYRDSDLNQAESGTKLVKGQQDVVQDSYKAADNFKHRMTVTSAAYSGSDERKTALDNNGIEEEQKSVTMAQQFKSVNANPLRQSEPHFLKKGGANQEVDQFGKELHARYGTVQATQARHGMLLSDEANRGHSKQTGVDSLGQSGAARKKNGIDSVVVGKGKEINGIPMDLAKPFPKPDPLKMKRNQLGLVKNPICRRFFTLFRIIGTLIMVMSLIADYTYAFKQTFSSKELFVAYLVLLGIRCLLPFVISLKNISGKVCKKEKNALPASAYEKNDDADSLIVKQDDHTKNGVILYSALPLAYFTGSYRLIDFKNFPGEIGTGLAIDFFINALPLLFIQAINNATLSQTAFESGHIFKFSPLQTTSMLFKLALLADIVLEFFMFLYELMKLHHLEKQAINVVVRYSEHERRQIFARKYMCRVIAWLTVIFLSFATVQIVVTSVDCRADQAAEWYSVCLNCNVEYCASCKESGYLGCDTCKSGFFFNEETGDCEDASCKIKQCESCDESGIWGCDKCNEGFYLSNLLQVCQSNDCQVNFCDECLVSGPNSCDKCRDGYEFNRETLVCEDKVCKKELCENCDTSGIYSCDRCKEGYYFDLEDLKCDTKTCKTKYCDKCTNPKVCEQCVKNYWFDPETKVCLDDTCEIENCGDCSISGPTKCDASAKGFVLQNGLPVDCDGVKDSILCNECTSPGECVTCNEGYRLQDGKCITCEESSCAQCDSLTGFCQQCKAGYYLDKSVGDCKKCKLGCFECSSYDFCTLCNPLLHQLVVTNDGKCLCDPYRGWNGNNQDFTCECKLDFFTDTGECKMCQDAFPGCDSCSRVGDFNEQTITGVRAMQNPAMPGSQSGIYMCDGCGNSKLYYDHSDRECKSCSKSISGCNKCTPDGEVCTDCKKWYSENKAGTCYSCTKIDSRCDRCNTSRCLDCIPNWSMVDNGQACWYNPF